MVRVCAPKSAFRQSFQVIFGSINRGHSVSRVIVNRDYGARKEPFHRTKLKAKIDFDYEF
jgi:hypothetical protein